MNLVCIFLLIWALVKLNRLKDTKPTFLLILCFIFLVGSISHFMFELMLELVSAISKS